MAPRKQQKANKPEAVSATVAAHSDATAISDKKARSVANLKSFKPGQSGNPSGRPKELVNVKKLARQFSERAVLTLAKIMEDEEASAGARVTAAEALLDRGFGKAVQQVEHGNAGAFTDMGDEDLDAFILEKATKYVEDRRWTN